MIVRVKLNASLRKFLPPGVPENVTQIDLPDGATVADAIDSLGIPRDHARIAVSGAEQLEMSSGLRDGQEVSLFPPLAGGS